MQNILPKFQTLLQARRTTWDMTVHRVNLRVLREDGNVRGRSLVPASSLIRFGGVGSFEKENDFYRQHNYGDRCLVKARNAFANDGTKWGYDLSALNEVRIAAAAVVHESVVGSGKAAECL